MKNHQFEDFWDSEFIVDDDDFDSEFKPNSLVSLPSSMSQSLGRAEQSFQQSQQQMIQSAMNLAIAELARACPEHFAGILLQQMGGRPLTLTETESDQHIEVTDRKVLGITVGSDVKTSTHIRKRSRQIGF